MPDSTEQTTKTSTTEALRRAIAALGYRAAVTDILDYARQHFGVGGGSVATVPSEAAATTPDAPARSKPAGRTRKSK